MKLSDENNINSNNDLDRNILLEDKPKTKKPSMYNVLLLNDDYTPMEFVTLLLETVFNKSSAEATRLMLNVHKKGRGIAGVYSREICETKCLQANHIAKESGHPFLVESEPE